LKTAEKRSHQKCQCLISNNRFIAENRSPKRPSPKWRLSHSDCASPKHSNGWKNFSKDTSGQNQTRNRLEITTLEAIAKVIEKLLVDFNISNHSQIVSPLYENYLCQCVLIWVQSNP